MSDRGQGEVTLLAQVYFGIEQGCRRLEERADLMCASHMEGGRWVMWPGSLRRLLQHLVKWRLGLDYVADF